MDLFYILAICLSTLIFIIFPISIIGTIYFILKKKTTRKIALATSSILLTIFGYYIVTGFFPGETFYIDNFEENTELKLPNSARFVTHLGNNSIYSFGDYNISYVYELSPKDYEDLYSHLSLRGFKSSRNYLETSENNQLINTNPTFKINKILTKDFGFKNFDILFLEDNKTIIFNSNKW